MNFRSRPTPELDVLRHLTRLIVCITALAAGAPGRADDVAPGGATPDGAITRTQVGYFRADGSNVSGYLVRPLEGSDLPAVVLVHDRFGLADATRAQADLLARAGHVVLAVDLYDGRATLLESSAARLADTMLADLPTAMRNIGAAVSWLRSLPYTDSRRVAVVSECFGDAWAQSLLASNLPVRATLLQTGSDSGRVDFDRIAVELAATFPNDRLQVVHATADELQARIDSGRSSREIMIRRANLAPARDPAGAASTTRFLAQYL